MSQVKIVRIVAPREALIEAVDLKTGATVVQILRESQTYSDITASRTHLERAVPLLTEMGHEVFAPARYKIPGAVEPTPDLADSFWDYCAIEFVDTLPQPRSGDGGGKPILTVEAALQAKTTTQGSVSSRKGKKTKTETARELIRANLDKSPEDVVKMIMEACEFKVGLARVYYKDNIKKILAETAGEAV